MSELNWLLKHRKAIIISLFFITLLVGFILINELFPHDFPKQDHKSATRIDGGRLDIYIDCYLNYIGNNISIAREGDKIVCVFNFKNTGNKTYYLNGTLDNSLLTMEKNSTDLWPYGLNSIFSKSSSSGHNYILSNPIEVGELGRHRFYIELYTYDASDFTLVDGSPGFTIREEYKVFSEESYEQMGQQKVAAYLTIFFAAIYSSISATKNLIDIFKHNAIKRRRRTSRRLRSKRRNSRT